MITNEQIEQYREIVENVPKGKGQIYTDYSFGRLVYLRIFDGLVQMHTEYGWTDIENWPFTKRFQSLDSLHKIIHQHDEIERLRRHLSEIAKKDDCIYYSQSENEYALQDCIYEAKEALSNE